MWWIHSNVSGTSRHVPLILQGLASCGDSTLLSQDPTLTAFLCFALFCCFFKLGSGHHRLLVLAQHCNQNLHVSPNWWVPSVLFGPCNTFFLLLGSSWLRNTESCDLVTGRKWAMCVDGLLQLLFFGSSAVAKCSFFHEAVQEFVNVNASFQEVFSRLLRLLLCLVSCDF